MLSENQINEIRKDFPILKTKVYDKPLIYFDNGATTQKPLQVIDRIRDYYLHENANIHRGAHYLSHQATESFEGVRAFVARTIHAQSKEEIIFTKGTTESINMVASGIIGQLKPGDEILITTMEHHANIVPWQMACEKTGAILKVVPLNERGELDIEAFKALLNQRTKILSLAHISNVLGTINPVEELCRLAHEKGAFVLVDGAQALPHQKVDMQQIDCDFYVFSGHKAYAPLGVGILYGKKDALELLAPWQGGGEMIQEVHFDKSTYNELPFRQEAGTPNIEAVLGLESALKYINNLGLENIAAYENHLLEYATEAFKKVGGIRIIGEAKRKASVLSFLIEGVHPFDAGTIIDRFGVAVRTGHHCAQPLMDYYQIPGTIRASFAFYNKKEEIDVLVQAIEKVQQMFL